MNNLTDEQLDRIAAEEVMGWIKTGIRAVEGEELPGGGTFREWYCTTEEEGDHYCGGIEEWHPTRDRNQSRLVVEAARVKHMGMGPKLTSEMAKVMPPGTRLDEAWHWATPRQEVEAAILAVRSIEVSNG